MIPHPRLFARWRAFSRASLLSLVCLVSAHGDEKWIQLKSAHFEMFTPYSAREAKEALARFEQARSFFLQASTTKAPTFPVRIVAFRGPKEYRPYQVNSGAIAFYLGTESQDFIVMQDLDTESYPIAVHEYTHLIVQHTGMKLPLWLNEGLADVYSTLEPHGDYVLVGRPLAGRVYSLAQTRWLPLTALFAVDQSSPYYNEREKMSIFYSQSWLLADMLMRYPAYSTKFNQLLATLNSGQGAAEALQTVYGKDLAAISKDAREYFSSNMLGPTTKVSKFSIKLEKSAEQPEVSPAPESEVRFLLADLLIGEQKVAEATKELLALSAQFPGNPRVEELWADQAWRQGRQRDMAGHCRKAFELGSQNPKLLAQCAAVETNQGVPSSEVIAALERSLKLDPTDVQARLNLAFLFLSEQKCGPALGQLAEIHSVKAEEASRFYAASGFCKMTLGSMEEARKDLELAKKWARSPFDQQQAARMLEELDAAAAARAPASGRLASPRPSVSSTPGEDSPSERPTIKRPSVTTQAPAPAAVESQNPPEMALPHVSGLLTTIECVGKTWQIHVKTASGERVFLITGPSDVQIRDESGEGSLTFGCGERLAKSVIVYYRLQADNPKLTGVAVLLDFVSAK